ncbi:MAG: hypothetical protein AB8H12_13235 [Lewinella sp.]
MPRYLFSALLLTVFSNLPAQSSPAEPIYRHQLTLTVGAHHGYVKDQNFSPLNYKASGLRFGLGYGRTTKSGHLLSAELGLGLTKLKSRASKYHTTERYLIDLSLGYLRAVGPAEGDRQIRLGGKYRSYIDVSIFEGTEAISFFALHGFELAGDAAWRTGDRHRLKVAGSLPVFGLLVRPPYTGWDKFISDNDTALLRILTRGKWTSLNDFTGLRASIGWEYRFNEKWTMEAGYGLSYYSTQRLDPVRILNNQFTVSATRKY